MIQCKGCSDFKTTEDFNPSSLKFGKNKCKICEKKERKNSYTRAKKRAIELQNSGAILKCRQCNQERDALEFEVCSLQKYDYLCKICKNENERIWWKENRS